MKSTQNYTVVDSFAGFKRFIQVDLYYITVELETFDSRFYDSEERITKYIQATHYKRLFDVFLASLNDDELRCINYLRYHDPISKLPENSDFYLHLAYQEWRTIFFKGQYKVFKDIDPSLLGIAMKTVRKVNNKTITLTAEALGSDRTTLSHFEHGLRMPSLNYLYKFCVMFNVSMDLILKVCHN